jgi:hypothetical protein
VLPSTLLFSYTGAFPVRDSASTFMFPDWKGNIAVDKKSFRAAESAVWYPQIYDAERDQLIDSYTYDLTVHCMDCKSVYINGALPQHGVATRFVSREPRDLLLFAGDFNYQELNKTIFVNTNLTPPQTKLLTDGTNEVINWYEKKLSAPYGSRIVYLVSDHEKRRNAWPFVTFPTIAVIGNRLWSIRNFFIEKPVLSLDSSSLHTIAHEVGHYYFGTQLRPNDSLQWTFLEGATEYMALQYARQKFGKNFYEKTLVNYLRSINHFTLPVSLAVARDTQLGDVYWYNYVPLLFTVLEGSIGEKKMWRWLSYLAKEKNVITNYTFFRNSLLASGVTESELKRFEDTYVLDKDAQKNMVEYFKSKMKLHLAET